jgi:hypothetical protein
MGKALEVLTGFTTAAGATITGLTMASGNSLTVRNCAFDKKVQLLNFWTDHQVAGIARIRSPKLHDNVQGIRVRTMISDVTPLMTQGQPQRLIPQDLLIAEQSGSAVAGDIETMGMLLYYEDLPGTDARLAKWADIQAKIANIVNNEVSLVALATGGYSGEVALNSSFDLLKANTDYALLGYVTNLESAVIGIRGADTGNLRVGGPGNETLRHVTAEWFKRLSINWDLPLIPVLNSANKAGVLVDHAQDENAGTSVVNLILAELMPGAITPQK